MLSIEQFARVRAAIESSGDCDRVLAEEKLTPEVWQGASRHYLAAFRREAELGAADLATRYLRAFHAALAPAPAQHMASFQREQLAEEEPVFNPDETAMLPTRQDPAAPVLPFSGETTPEMLAELLARTPRQSIDSDSGSNYDETLMMPLGVAVQKPSSGTFTDDLTADVVPILSVDEYAELRAELSVRGESDADTLKRFGVMSPNAHAALKARFAEYFQKDPEAQRRFVDTLKRKMGARPK